MIIPPAAIKDHSFFFKEKLTKDKIILYNYKCSKCNVFCCVPNKYYWSWTKFYKIFEPQGFYYFFSNNILNILNILEPFAINNLSCPEIIIRDIIQ